MLEASLVTLLIFAGGKASRMEGRNKALVPYCGRPMVEYVVKSLEPYVSRVLVSANRDREAFAALGLTTFSDVRDDFPGPLAALEALHTKGLLQTPWVLTAPCDVPEVPAGVAPALLKAQAAHPEKRVFAAFNKGWPQNAFMLVHKDALAEVAPFLDEGERKVGFWLRRQGVEFAEVDGDFTNFNSMAELEAAELARGEMRASK